MPSPYVHTHTHTPLMTKGRSVIITSTRPRSTGHMSMLFCLLQFDSSSCWKWKDKSLLRVWVIRKGTVCWSRLSDSGLILDFVKTMKGGFGLNGCQSVTQWGPPPPTWLREGVRCLMQIAVIIHSSSEVAEMCCIYATALTADGVSERHASCGSPFNSLLENLWSTTWAV